MEVLKTQPVLVSHRPRYTSAVGSAAAAVTQTSSSEGFGLLQPLRHDQRLYV